jgi:hypothetical protein
MVLISLIFVPLFRDIFHVTHRMAQMNHEYVLGLYFISWFTGPPTLKFPISEKKLNWDFFFPPTSDFQKNSRKPTNKKKALLMFYYPYFS